MSALRVQYRERQVLQAADLQDEQQFLLDTLSRHTLNAHSSGIARGLALHLEESGAPVVDPGVAIDANGRQLVLWETQTVAGQLPNGGAADVWLLFCGEQFNLPIPGRFRCGPADYARSREVAMVRCVPTGGDPPDDAGVLLGSVQPEADGKKFAVDTSNARYAILRGASVCHPAKSAFLQIGKSYGSDPNQFVINISDASGAATKRFTIDRNGKISIYGNVELSSYRARLRVGSPDDNALLLVEAAIPGPAGESIAVTVEEGTKGLNLQFADVITGATESLNEIELGGKKAARDKVIAKFHSDPRMVRLSWLDSPAAEEIPRAAHGEETNLSTSGSSLLLADAAAVEPADGPKPLGCQELVPSFQPSRGTNGLSFLPTTAPVAGSPARGIYTVKLDPKDSQRQEFRLDLGKHQNQDLSKRLSIGAIVRKEKQFSEWLTVLGNCAVTLVDQKHSVKKLPISIRAKGYIQLAPVKPDLSNPLFKNLMIAAWLNGLRSAVAASSSVSIVFNGVPNPIDRADWHYTVDVTNIGSQTVSIDKVLETMTYDGQTVVQSIAYQGNLTVGQTASLQVKHHDVPDTISVVTLEVIVSGKIANASWWSSATTTTRVQAGLIETS